MNIYPYSGGPATQTILSMRDSSTNSISFVAEYSDTTRKITFYRKDSSGSLTPVGTPSLTLTKGNFIFPYRNLISWKNLDAWNRLIIEYTQAQPLNQAGAHYSLRIYVGSTPSSRVYFSDSAGTASPSALFFGVDNMILDFCSQWAGGTTTPAKPGNFDIMNFLWFSGPSIVFSNTKCKYRVFSLIKCILM